MNEKIEEAATKAARSPIAVAGGLVGGGSLFALIISMSMNNGELLSDMSRRLERIEGKQDSIQAAVTAGDQRIESETDKRFRPLELAAAQGGRFTQRDGDAMEKRIEALERVNQWQGRHSDRPAQ